MLLELLFDTCFLIMGSELDLSVTWPGVNLGLVQFPDHLKLIKIRLIFNIVEKPDLAEAPIPNPESHRYFG